MFDPQGAFCFTARAIDVPKNGLRGRSWGATVASYDEITMKSE
jgi:hypothetical protein